ncbi:1-deoxy-D-xylulose-5-phosphate synthase [Chlamydiifrater phoenicopteri]|uniref:1-deoxy-D-xylulose-5-phosphate synthase n=1 Tax=Chlamydiifrater phoenicopteri TaxID=2681469 RepID=UPI001BCC7D4C|nr:1-deoxy-D-xylulose-5-phosphate synthase [Chlamydiifrater phoenicopteri]
MIENVNLLDKVLSPEHLRQLSPSDLPLLAEEIRHKIVYVLSQTGGHLSSNLGCVELSLAMHYVFNSPQDKFVFDVGHQCYTHKLITGRNDQRFCNIRKNDGLSGFSNPEESPHDLFYTGHAGNALSLALGLAETEKQQQSNNHVLCFIGDAALSCGLTLEALNNIPDNLENFVIILNDNKMSISENVGSTARILSKLLNHPTAGKLRNKIGRWLRKIPRCGSKLEKRGRQVSISLKNLFCPAPFFEQFGLSYVGPVDGHNITKLVTLLEAVKNQPFPVIIHAVTTKGKGFDDAQENPAAYHGVAPSFCKKAHLKPEDCREVAVVTKQKESFPQIFGRTVCELAAAHPSLSVVTPAMSLGSCLEDFKKSFPDNFYDVGIAEGHAVAFSGGMAKLKQGKVICSIYSTFLLRALDNLFHDVCMQKIPVVFAIDRAGLAFEDGRSHHGIYDLAFLRAMPDMIIAQPRNGNILRDLLFSSMDWNYPSAIRYPKVATESSKHPPILRHPGSAEILHQGEDILIIALGHTYQKALQLRAKLLEQGISPTIMDPIFIKPLDTHSLSLLLMTHSKIVTIEEHSLKGGLASEINDFLISFGFGKSQVLSFGVPDQFLNHDSAEAMYKSIGMDVETMFAKVMTTFGFRLRHSSPYVKYRITSAP